MEIFGLDWGYDMVLPDGTKVPIKMGVGPCGGGPVKGVCKTFTKSMLSNSQLIAKGSEIRKINELVAKFGGTRKGWKKKKGWDSCGNEWHWYEHHGIGRKGEKLAGAPDPF